LGKNVNKDALSKSKISRVPQPLPIAAKPHPRLSIPKNRKKLFTNARLPEKPPQFSPAVPACTPIFFINHIKHRLKKHTTVCSIPENSRLEISIF